MREIKSKSFLRKQAAFEITDKGLPGQLREQDFLAGDDPDEQHQTGQTEVGNYTIDYEYDYDYNENRVNNLRVTKARSYETERWITDEHSLDKLQNMYESEIVADIRIAEEGARIERSPGYNPFEG